MNKPLVSVLVTSYNKSKYICETLKSVEHQVDFPSDELEIIVVDDCSKDNSYQRLVDFSRKNGTVSLTLLKNNKNMGVAKSRNIAAEAANGKYLFHIDGDDLYGEKCVSRIVTHFEENPHVGFVYSNHALIVQESSFPVKDSEISAPSNKPFFNLETFLKNRVNTVGAIRTVKTNKNILFDPSLKYAEDMDWVGRLALENVKFGFVPDVLYYWRVGIGDCSLSVRMNSSATEWHNYIFDKLTEKEVKRK